MTGKRKTIRKTGVIGAGTMGAGIAAQMANAGLEVVLLDLPADEGHRDKIARDAIERMLKTGAAPFMHPDNAKRITPGNVDDHLNRLADCDWIVEAVAEDRAIKHATYESIEQVRRSDAIVSSNTSTIPLKDLITDVDEGFRKHFLITHFFNPPRQMRLLEMVRGQDTDPDVFETIRDFSDRVLGKGVVECKDTPGFIANRIGAFWAHAGLVHAIDLGLSIEEADAIMSRPVGIPKTGVFGLMDLVGLDIMKAMSESVLSNVPGHDDFHRIYNEPPIVAAMHEDGRLGRKSGAGFYRLKRDSGKKVMESMDLASGAYSPVDSADLDSLQAAKQGLRELVTHDDRGGRFAAKVLMETMAYAAGLIPDIAERIVDVDEAMRLGYGWTYGPFELIDQVGVDWLIGALKEAKKPVPDILGHAGANGFYTAQDGVVHYLTLKGSYAPLDRPEGVEFLADIKTRHKPVASNENASLWDVGDGVLCFELHSKLNTQYFPSMEMLTTAVEMAEKDFKALVLYSEAAHFSAGANLGACLEAGRAGKFEVIDDLIKAGQGAFKAIKFAKVPVVGAPTGLALGGGCELCLHCDALQAHAETSIGLVEARVGLIPGWGGCKEMLIRWVNEQDEQVDRLKQIVALFRILGRATFSGSAQEAKDYKFIRASDGITMNRDRLLADAKTAALKLAKGYTPPQPETLRLPGQKGTGPLNAVIKEWEDADHLSPHDYVVLEHLVHVLTGGNGGGELSEDAVLDLEREAFVELCKTAATLDRFEHTLKTGKPLKN